MSVDAQRELILALGRDPVQAHTFLFPHRHTDPLTSAHIDFIEWFHSDEEQVEFEGFRGFGKSTLAEEGVIIKALYKRFKNALVISATSDLSVEHLATIATELLSNERINTIFGEQTGDEWSAEKIVLANGVALQAISKGQKMRGTRHKEDRPDFLYIDDVEDDEDVREPKARSKTRQWFFRKLLPACAPPGHYQARVLGTDLDPESLLSELKRSGWVARKYPLLYLGDDGKEHPTWPARFPREVCERIRDSYMRRGAMRDFDIEYQCQVDRPQDKAFAPEMIRVHPHVRTWQAVYQMWDPARTVNESSADTGYAAWSWIGPKLVIWDAYGRKMMPDAIVNAIYQEAEGFDPIWVGVEEDGLNQWLMQPLRQKALHLGRALPIRGVKAPPGKISFIKGLQPFFMAREVEFAKDLPELKQQLLNFPKPPIDIPNALAYALRLRPGAPIYDEFGSRHMTEDMRAMPREPLWLALNAAGGLVSGVLVQSIDGALRVYKDWVMEGDPQSVIHRIVTNAVMEAGQNVRIVCGAVHYDRHNNAGLVQAVKALPAEPWQGTKPEQGRAYLRSILTREHQHMPMLQVNQGARWTANGLAGGFSRALMKGNIMSDVPEEGMYRVVIEGLEAFCGRLAFWLDDDDNRDNETGIAYTSDGRRYRSAIRAR